MLAVQAHEQQRQLSYVQSMHAWAAQVATSLRALQKQSRTAAGSAGAAQEEASAAKASLVQLAGLQDSNMQQVCQLSLEVADLKEQVNQLLMETGRSGGGGRVRKRGGAAAPTAQQAAARAAAQAAAQQQQQEPGLQPCSPKRARTLPHVPTAPGALGGADASGMPQHQQQHAAGMARGEAQAMVPQPGSAAVPYYHMQQQLPYPMALHLHGEPHYTLAACAVFGGAAK